MLMLSPWIALAGVVVGGLAVLLTRHTTIGAIAGAVAGLIAVVALGATGRLSLWLLPGAAAWCLLVILGFHDNIGRLLKGTETRLGG
jgi:glycerol-3-phosphate acyltransferase PlsY